MDARQQVGGTSCNAHRSCSLIARHRCTRFHNSYPSPRKMANRAASLLCMVVWWCVECRSERGRQRVWCVVVRKEGVRNDDDAGAHKPCDEQRQARRRIDRTPLRGGQGQAHFVQPVQLIADSTTNVHLRWVQRAALCWGQNESGPRIVCMEASLARSFGRARGRA